MREKEWESKGKNKRIKRERETEKEREKERIRGKRKERERRSVLYRRSSQIVVICSSCRNDNKVREREHQASKREESRKK